MQVALGDPSFLMGWRFVAASNDRHHHDVPHAQRLSAQLI